MKLNGEPIAFSGALTIDDLTPGFQHAHWHRSWVSKSMTSFAVLMLIGFAGEIVLNGWPSGWIGMLWPVFLLGYVIFLPVLQSRSLMKSQKHLGEEGQYEFSGEGLRITKPSMQVSIPWSSIHSVVERKAHFLIYTTKNCFFPVPKRLIPVGREEAWRAVVNSHIPISKR
jgi:hypothetical protein